MRTTPASDDYTWSRYHSPGYTMTFNVAGASGTWEEGGAFVIAHELDADSGAGTSPVAGMGLFSSGLEGAPDFVFALSEDAGAGAVDRMAVGLWADGPSSSMNRDLDDGTGRLVFMRDMTSYFPAGPVLLPGELMHQEEGFYTGRG
ncbi:TPA: hypothetical protein EYP38_00160, partial [Candidatus Micrarchaeota archaeon]|nr:hypothetical protein [Candidatus Micrarchaeota archaeon]